MRLVLALTAAAKFINGWTGLFGEMPFIRVNTSFIGGMNKTFFNGINFFIGLSHLVIKILEWEIQ